MAKTKALMKFLNRAARFDGDVEFVDVIASASKNGHLTPTAESAVFVFVDATKHPRLSKQKATDHNRQLVVRHLKSTVHGAFIKDIYEDLTAYITDILAAAARHGLSPDRLIGEHKLSIEVNDLLRCGSWDAVIRLVAESLFRRIENERSTKKLIDSLDTKLNLNLDKAVLAGALPYLDLRHLLVHRDGVADAAFCKAHPDIGATVGERVSLRHDVVSNARNAIVLLANHVDTRVVAVGAVGKPDLQ